MRNMLRKFVADESGLETVEYAVMTALIVTAVVLAIGAIAIAIEGRFGDVENVIVGIEAPAP